MLNSYAINKLANKLVLVNFYDQTPAVLAQVALVPDCDDEIVRLDPVTLKPASVKDKSEVEYLNTWIFDYPIYIGLVDIKSIIAITETKQAVEIVYNAIKSS